MSNYGTTQALRQLIWKLADREIITSKEASDLEDEIVSWPDDDDD